jgi:hypothetical protein
MQLKDIVARFLYLDIFDFRYDAVTFRFFSWTGITALLVAYSAAYAVAYTQSSVAEKCVVAVVSGGNVVATCPGVAKQVLVIVALATIVVVLASIGSALFHDLNAWKLVDDTMVGAFISLLLLSAVQSAPSLRGFVSGLSGATLYGLTSAAAVLVMLGITAWNRKWRLPLRDIFTPVPVCVLVAIFVVCFASQYTLVLA